MKFSLYLFSVVACASSQAAVTLAGFSTANLVTTSGDVALTSAASYEVGFFASSSVPSNAAEFAEFTVILTRSMAQQEGGTAVDDGQFQFEQTVESAASLGLASGDFERRLGIRFFDETGNETNTVSASASSWILNNPDGDGVSPPATSDNALLNLDSDSGIVWLYADNSFQTVAIPEPSVLVTGMLGLFGVALRRRR